MLDASADLDSMEQAFVHTTPTKVLALDPDSCHGNHKLNGTPPNHRYHGNLHGYNSNGEEDDSEEMESELTDAGLAVQYSCADMTEGILTKSPFSLHSDSILDDDATTTTSGSYVVDPQDLCDEIDELFFKDMGL